jgi:hypothetical protein
MLPSWLETKEIDNDLKAGFFHDLNPLSSGTPRYFVMV